MDRSGALPIGESERGAPPAVEPPPGHPRFPLIDGLRAIAALSVLLYHVALFARPGNQTIAELLLELSAGVPIFFVISGFLLYRPFIAHLGGGAPAPRVHVYAWRRALRIIPAYWLILAALLLAPGIAPFDGALSIWDLAVLHYAPLPGNEVCAVNVNQCGLAQTWSLSVEVIFYALLPLAAIATTLIARRGGRHWLGVILLALALLGAGSVLAGHLSEGGGVTVMNGTPAGFFLWFATGMGLAAVSVAPSGRRRTAIQTWIGAHAAWLWALGAMLLALTALGIPPSPLPISPLERTIGHVNAGLVGLLLMLPVVFGARADRSLGRLLASRPIAWLGLVSYGIFLWHFVIALKLGSLGEGLSFLPLLAITLTATIALAAISYYAVERPALRLKYRGPNVPETVPQPYPSRPYEQYH